MSSIGIESVVGRDIHGDISSSEGVCRCVWYRLLYGVDMKCEQIGNARSQDRSCCAG